MGIMKEIKGKGEKDHDPEKRDEIVQKMVLNEINQKNVIEKLPIIKKSRDLVDHPVQVEIRKDQRMVLRYLLSRAYETGHAQIVEIMKPLIIIVYHMIIKAINI